MPLLPLKQTEERDAIKLFSLLPDETSKLQLTFYQNDVVAQYEHHCFVMDTDECSVRYLSLPENTSHMLLQNKRMAVSDYSIREVRLMDLDDDSKSRVLAMPPDVDCVCFTYHGRYACGWCHNDTELRIFKVNHTFVLLHAVSLSQPIECVQAYPLFDVAVIINGEMLLDLCNNFIASACTDGERRCLRRGYRGYRMFDMVGSDGLVASLSAPSRVTYGRGTVVSSTFSKPGFHVLSFMPETEEAVLANANYTKFEVVRTTSTGTRVVRSIECSNLLSARAVGFTRSGKVILFDPHTCTLCSLLLT